MNTKKIALATIIVMAGAILSKLLGFGREVALAAVFGAKAATDAYLVAMIIPAIFFGIVSNAITTAGIPVFSEYLHQPEKKKEFHSLIRSSFHIMILVLVLFVLLCFPLAPWLVKILAPGFSPWQASITTELVKIMLPMIIFMGLAGWAQGVLNSCRHFTMPALMGIPYNIVMICGILTAGLFGGIKWVAWATVLATSTQFLIQAPALYRHGFSYKWELNWRHPALRKIFFLLGPVAIGLGANQLNVIVDRMMASGLVEGSISALSYAQRSLGLVQGLFAIPLITVLYPSLTRRKVLNDPVGFQKVLDRGLTHLAFIVLPLSTGLVVLRFDITQFLFERGAFDRLGTQMTAVALLFYGLGLIFLIWRDLLDRAFYAAQDTVTPMWTGLASVAVNVVLNLLLVRYLAHGGLALASSVASAVACLLLFLTLRSRFGYRGIKALLSETARITAASLFMGVIVWWLGSHSQSIGFFNLGGWLGYEEGAFSREIALRGLRIGILVICGGLIYAVSCRLLKVKELDLMLELLKKKEISAWISCRLKSQKT